MIPTAHMRYVLRSSLVESSSGPDFYRAMPILQQLWCSDLRIKDPTQYSPGELVCSHGGEWRDIPIVEEANT